MRGELRFSFRRRKKKRRAWGARRARAQGRARGGRHLESRGWDGRGREKGKGKREGKREIVYSRWGIEVACAERPVWFAAKLPATAQAPNTLFTFDQHRGEEARCSNEENKGVVVGNVSAACRTISAPRFRRNRENSRIGGSWGAFERDSWRSTGASSSLNGRVSSTLCVSDLCDDSLSLFCLQRTRARVSTVRAPRIVSARQTTFKFSKFI